MNRYRSNNKKWWDTGFSPGKATIATLVFCLLALIYVKKEVALDETSRRMMDLEREIVSLQTELTEEIVEYKHLSSYPRIRTVAARLGMKPLSQPPEVVKIELSEIPPEFDREFLPVDYDNLLVDDAQIGK